MKLLLRIVTGSINVIAFLALLLGILIIAEMKSWNFLWLYLPLIMCIYEMEKVQLRKKRNNMFHKNRRYFRE